MYPEEVVQIEYVQTAFVLNIQQPKHILQWLWLFSVLESKDKIKIRLVVHLTIIRQTLLKDSIEKYTRQSSCSIPIITVCQCTCCTNSYFYLRLTRVTSLQALWNSDISLTLCCTPTYIALLSLCIHICQCHQYTISARAYYYLQLMTVL